MPTGPRPGETTTENSFSSPLSARLYCALVPEEDSLMMSKWPEFKAEWNFATEELQVERMKEIIRGVRNVRAEMNVPNSRKATVYVVCEDDKLRQGLKYLNNSAVMMAAANDFIIQGTKEGIADDAVSIVVPDATVYVPLEELIDFAQEIERLEKEEARLEKELARVNGMLSNERFISKAPQAKIDEEKAKLEKYTQMMEQVKMRLAGLRK